MQNSLRAGLLTAHLTRSGGGVYTSVRQLAWALEMEPGLEVDVFGPSQPGKNLSSWEPVPPRTARLIGPRFFSYAPGLARKLARAQLDVLHLHGLWMHPSMACNAFTQRTRKPHMVSPHGMLDPWAVKNSGWKKRFAAAAFEKTNLRSAACLHALNDAEVESIRNYGLAGPVCVIPNGVEIPERLPETPMPWWCKSAPEVKTLLYLGRLHPKKGLPDLLVAWSRMEPKVRKQWRLVIAGWDERGHKQELNRISAAYRIDASIFLPGPLFGDEKKSAFHHCDAFILPSLSEGQPMGVLEAWAWGKPVLMTPQCNLPEGFDADAAVRIEPGNDGILNGLTELAAMDDAARAAMGERGRNLVRERFAWPVIAADMAGVYQWLAGRGPQPPSIVES
ncbi:MAG TPA: glycosyltransferase [Chthoniobacteraceae bacterium]|jgi:poly(glycerol-phosphate) alpha-glucosyltransferase|nr:glycosyltransferase [Chthoniobacteraceae bacterium]